MLVVPQILNFFMSPGSSFVALVGSVCAVLVDGFFFSGADSMSPAFD